MTKFLLATLTTFFLAVMPLQAAYSQNGNADVVPPICDTETVDRILTSEQYDQVHDDGGYVTHLQGAPKDAFVARLSELAGSPPPYAISDILLVKPAEDAEIVNVGVFSNSCFKTVIRLPEPVVETLLAPFEEEKKPAGERVD